MIQLLCIEPPKSGLPRQNSTQLRLGTMAATGPASPDTAQQAAPAATKGAAAPAPSPTAVAAVAATPPTYLARRGSAAYVRAKALLAAGDLDEALAVLEAALQRSRQALEADFGGDGDDGAGLDLHESLAPLYYL